MAEYSFTKKVDAGFSETVRNLRAALHEQGFGVLTEIDVKKTLKEKLNVDTEKYLILGACNPNYAHKALEKEKNLGLLLPCNAIAYRESGKTVVGVVSPMEMLRITGNEDLVELAEEVEKSMKKAIDSL